MGKSIIRYDEARKIFTKEEIPSEEYFLVTELVWHFITDKYYPEHEIIQENYSSLIIRKAAKIYEEMRSFYHDSFPCNELLEDDIIMLGFFDDID